MSAPRIMKQSRVPVADVVVGHRLRPVSQAGLAAILTSIEHTGVMKDAIHVRKHHSGELRLMAGAHRLAAAKELGWDEIEAKVWTDVTDDWAQLIEIDDNLAGAEMCPLDNAIFLARRKEVYERMHPETKAGVAGASARWMQRASRSVASFATVTAEKFGISDQQVRKIIAAGTRLGPDEVAQLRRAPKPVTLADLQVISKIVNPTERYDVIDLLEEGRAKSAGDAVKQIAQRDQGGEVASADPAQAALADLSRRWSRAPMAAKRRFVEEHWAEMSRIMRDGAADLTEVA